MSNLIEKELLGELFYRFAEVSNDVYWVQNADYTKLLYLNPAYEKVWGRPRKELLDHPERWFEYLVAEDVKRLAQNVGHRKDIADPEGYVQEYRVKRPDGSIIWIRDTSYPIYDKTGSRLLGYIGIAKDVTNSLFVDSHLLPKLANRLTQLVFWARDVTMTKLFYLSSGFEGIWGVNTDEIYESPERLMTLIHLDDRTKLRPEDMYARVEQEGAQAKFAAVYRIIRPDAEMRWLSSFWFPVFDEREVFTGFAGYDEDITERYLTSQQLMLAKEAAESANRAKSEFIASMSHDFRTPLYGILGMAELLASHPLKPDYQEFIDGILKSGHSLLTLVEDILSFSSHDLHDIPVKHDVFDLHKLVQEAVEMLKPLTAEQDDQVNVSYPAMLPKQVVGDVQRVRRIIINLLSNSVKFTKHGRIDLSIDAWQKRDASWLFKLTIQDSGKGIAKDKLNYIFESFGREDPSYSGRYRGTGLGLTIVKKFIDDLKGTVNVVSEVGVGTTFTVTLGLEMPLPHQIQQSRKGLALDSKDDVLDEPDESDEQNEPHSGRRLKVLLVEDEVFAQKISTMMLAKAGCEVDLAKDGQQALKLSQWDYDLILLDIGLPDISGYEVASEIRRRAENDFPMIIALTAHVLDSDKQKAFDVGMNDVLSKPITQKQINRMIRQLSTKKEQLAIN